jgi:hypothetical protein
LRNVAPSPFVIATNVTRSLTDYPCAALLGSACRLASSLLPASQTSSTSSLAPPRSTAHTVPVHSPVHSSTLATFTCPGAHTPHAVRRWASRLDDRCACNQPSTPITQFHTPAPLASHVAVRQVRRLLSRHGQHMVHSPRYATLTTHHPPPPDLHLLTHATVCYVRCHPLRQSAAGAVSSPHAANRHAP